MPDWNENIRYSRILHHLNDHCDITNVRKMIYQVEFLRIQYASNKKYAVDSRDFVAARMMKITDDGRYIISAKSCQISTVPEDKNAVRYHIKLMKIQSKFLMDFFFQFCDRFYSVSFI